MLETADEAPLGTATLPLRDDLALVVCGVRGSRSVTLRSHAPIHIGRASGCELVLADRSISRLHARFSRVAEGVLVEDLGSRHGTWVAGARVERAALGLGAAVRVGDVVIAVTRAAPPTDPSADLRARAADARAPVGARTLHQPMKTPAEPPLPAPTRDAASMGLRARLRTMEHAQVKRALELSAGNQRQAAELVGLPLRNFERRLRALRTAEAERDPGNETSSP